MRHAGPVVLVCCLLTACGGRTLVVESDTEWSGTVEEVGEIEGRYDDAFDIPSAGKTICWTIRKTTALGTLRAYAKDHEWFGLANDVDGDMTTTAPNGEVTGCAY